MTRLSLAFGLVTFIGVVNLPYSSAFPADGHELLRRQSSMSWGPCWSDMGDKIRPFTVTCANFTVPLDWTNDQNGQKAILNVVKVSPKEGSSTGTIFNTGGENLMFGSWGWKMFNITQGRFDIVSWDPRGVGESQPRISCFDAVPGAIALDLLNSPSTNFASNLTMLNSLESSSSGPTQTDIDALMARAPQVDAYFKTMVDKCQQKHGDNLKHVGIVATVKDLIAIANAIVGADQPIHYWGLNYGTLTAQYFMSLYPKRVGRVVLDGVVDVETQQRGIPHQIFSSDIQDAELSLTKFYQACADAGPGSCRLATAGSSAESIRQSVNRLLDVAYQAGVKPGLFDKSSTTIRSWLYAAAGLPEVWPSASEPIIGVGVYYNITNRRRSGLSRRYDKVRDDVLENQYASYYARVCGDLPSDVGFATTNEVTKELVRITKEQSNTFGPVLTTLPEAYCHLWPVRSVERFQGPFNPQLVNPIILIGVSASTTNPIANAISLHSKLNSGGSRKAALIQHDGVGATSFGMPSVCTEQIIGNYFINGEVPADTLCGTNFIPFPNSTVPRTAAPSSIISAPLQSSTQQGSNGARGVDYGCFLGLSALIVVGAASLI